MTFSTQWDVQYKEGGHQSQWPWSDLVSYVMRYSRPGPGTRVLDLGCGAGANIPFLKSLQCDYYGVDGSPFIIDNLRNKFPELKDRLVVGDFTEMIPFLGVFDLVVDRSSLTCNTTAAIKRSLKLIHDHLKHGGKYIGIDWFSTLDTNYDLGVQGADKHTRRDYTEGRFADIGAVHFSDKSHLQELFAGFSITVMEHKTVRREIPADHHVVAAWNLVAEKE